MAADMTNRGEELAVEAGRMAGELINAGRPDLAEWPLAVAQRVCQPSAAHAARVVELSRRPGLTWQQFLTQEWRLFP